jgi:oligopeptide/dipeptide ABC transporter ATP-binding protein
MENEAILEVKNLRTYFHTSDGVVPAVDDVSFTLRKGETLGIVGESGCGKSVTSMSIMRLIDIPGKIEGGEILFHNEDLVKARIQRIRQLRGSAISMIFQEPMTSLNPVFQIGDQISETLTLHQGLGNYSFSLRVVSWGMFWKWWFTWLFSAIGYLLFDSFAVLGINAAIGKTKNDCRDFKIQCENDAKAKIAKIAENAKLSKQNKFQEIQIAKKELESASADKKSDFQLKVNRLTREFEKISIEERAGILKAKKDCKKAYLEKFNQLDEPRRLKANAIVTKRFATAAKLKKELQTIRLRTPAWQRSIEMLKLVGIPDPERRILNYPHEMSGGMKQRVMIALAMACNPEILIADEATTALDVTIQAQILELMKELKKKFGTAVMLITHNLAVVAEMAENIIVMYAGKIVEYGSCKDIFENPMHPYTWGLLHSIPRVDQAKTDEKLPTIEGLVPNPYRLPVGCKFHPRCPRADQHCREQEPPLETFQDGRQCRCWHKITKGEL